MPDRQRVLLICESRNIDRLQINKLGFFLRCRKTPDAWYCLRNFMQQVKGWSGQYWLPIDERFAMPVSPHQDSYFATKEEIKILIDQDKVAEQAANFTATETELQAKQSRFNDFLGIAALGAVSAFIILILLVASGKVNLNALFKGFGG